MPKFIKSRETEKKKGQREQNRTEQNRDEKTHVFGAEVVFIDALILLD